MRNLTKTISTIVIILVGLFYYQNAFADTHNAASCSSADVATAITASANGDTVTIPPGDCSGTPWTTGVTIPLGKNITIQGAGYTNTIIAHSGCDAFNLNGTASRLTGIQIKHIPDTSGIGVAVYKTGWRIDHCYLNRNDDRDAGGATTYEYVAIGTYVTNGGKVSGMPTAPVTGLIDNNIIHGRIDLNGFTSTPAATEWTQASHIGTEDAVYVEDNVFNRIDCDHANVIDSNRGISYVARYNTITGHAQFMAHGTQLNTRGTRNWEIYGNNFVADKSVWIGPLAVMGGSGIVAFNTSNANYQQGSTAHIYPYVMNGCTGDYPCTDQVGRGQNQTLDPAYWFVNFVGASKWTRYRDVSQIQEDRDYYISGSSFNGTSGVGCGTLANRPGTCTAGVGYWATDQSCSDLTDYTGASPTTPISGTLYKCTATNTWTAYYTPYTYPHPLRGVSDEVAPTATWEIDATGLIATATFSESVNATTKTGVSFTGSVTGAITATYKDGMPGSIVRYDLNKEVQQSDTVVVDYTTPGDGIKDLAGNALADISDGAVSNGSTQGTPPLVTLTIGTHTGATVNVYPGINCGSTCGPVEYDSGSVLTLNVTTLRNYTGCTIGGTGCGASTTMSEARTCTVTCTKISPDVAIGSGAAVTLGSGAVGTLY